MDLIGCNIFHGTSFLIGMMVGICFLIAIAGVISLMEKASEVRDKILKEGE